MMQFIEIEQNPAPRGAIVETFQAADGAKLRAAYYPADAPRGTIIVEPGWAEFIEKYFEVADDLRQRQFNVAMMDWRGQGRSDAPAQWAGYFDQLADDLRAFREGPVADRFAGPYFLLTHSMGGMPALLLLGGGYDGFERAALSAPMTRLFAGPTNAVFNAVASVACLAGAAKTEVFRRLDDSKSFEGNVLTTDPARHERFRLLQATAPEVAIYAPTYGWVRDAISASKRLHSAGFFDALTTPVRIISAEAEQVVDGGDHAAIAAMSERIEQVRVDGALHEIMMERDEYREPFWRYVDEFFAPAIGDSR